MQMPEVTEHHRKLEAMVGEWIGAETIHPSPWDPNSGASEGRFTTRVGLDGFFVIADYEQRRDGKVSFEGHGVYGYDDKRQRYTMHWFDTMGADPGAPTLGTWTGDTLCFEHQHHMGHSRYTYQFDGTDKFAFKLEMSQDGEHWNLFLEGAYTRVE